MSERWLGVVVVGDKVTIVDTEVSDSGPLKIVADLTWDLQKGDRAQGYRVMADRIANHARENKIFNAVIKGSALSQGGTRLAHLESAELRGVAMAALASVTNVQSTKKGHISKHFGDRKADEYLADDAFWKKEISGTLRKGSREAALLILATKK